MKNLTILLSLLIFSSGYSQKRKKSTPAVEKVNVNLFNGMKYRSVGPTRGGRSTAIAGFPSKQFSFLMGATGGGVWRTDDAGQNWKNISDGQITVGSIGAIEVASSDENVIYVGTGSACPRGNVSLGNGMYRSTDEGENWESIGLKAAGQIGKVIVHPDNADIVWVAALGNAFTSNSERGVYKTTDGGKSWSKVLFINNQTGAVDLAINPANPRILYAAMWQMERKPWTIIDGGEMGGIFQSKDGGTTWEKLKGGLPNGVIGRIGLTVSPANPDRIWAQIQAKEEESGGLYRSDNGGKKWDRVNRDHKLRQRGWYYSHVTADPQDENTVYASNTGFYKSIDGGKTFDRIRTPHGDNHGVWVNPYNTQIMINCNDGGANVSLNGGASWSTQLNQPTSEFYRVTVDNQFPYRLYAGQQDNSTITVPSQYVPSLTSTQQWYSIGGGESADVAVHPTNPNIVYAGTYSGEVTYVNLGNGERRQITAYPHYTEGTEQRNLKYRFQWNYPLFVSKHNSDAVFIGSQFVHRSTDKGQTWDIISPDLTQDLDKYQDIPGGPVQHDATGVEVYSSIFALEESPHAAGTIWAGSDDGLIHITKDAGKTWQNITPSNMPSEGTVNKIELSSHADGRAIVAVYKYRDGDFKPYIFLTDDFGDNWKLLTTGSNGIPNNHFVRGVAEDAKVKGLIYAGTEYGMYVSFDNGSSWQSLQLNLPNVPITDIETVENDLAISTQGRSFWVLDDLSPLQQASSAKGKNVFLYEIQDAYRTNIGGKDASVNFYLNKVDTSALSELTILDSENNIAKKWSTKADKDANEIELELKDGFNQVKWNLTSTAPKMVKNFVAMDFSSGREPGSKAAPGKYRVVLKVGDTVLEESFDVKVDPRWDEITNAKLQQKFELEQDVISTINASQDMIREIRSIREQANSIAKMAVKAGHNDRLKTLAKELDKKLTTVEDQLFQNKTETTQDEINFPRVFSNHIVRLFRVIVDEDNAPTGGMLERWEDLQKAYADIVSDYESVKENELMKFQNAVAEENVDRIIIGK
ncbi:MAG: glycosyl hydrolase [Cyclobacteriaceae bacterium]